MEDDTTITPFHQPGSVIDPLTEIARDGARQMLAAALKAEAASFVAQFAEERLPDGRQRVVHHGAGPERSIQTGIGPIPVQRQKIRDRSAGCAAGEQDPVQLAHPAEMGAALAQPRCLAPGPLLAGRLDRGLPGGPERAGRDRMRRTCRRARSRVSPASGRVSMIAGNGATSLRGAMSTSGPTVSISRPGWSLRPSACW